MCEREPIALINLPIYDHVSGESESQLMQVSKSHLEDSILTESFGEVHIHETARTLCPSCTLKILKNFFVKLETLSAVELSAISKRDYFFYKMYQAFCSIREKVTDKDLTDFNEDVKQRLWHTIKFYRMLTGEISFDQAIGAEEH